MLFCVELHCQNSFCFLKLPTSYIIYWSAVTVRPSAVRISFKKMQ